MGENEAVVRTGHLFRPLHAALMDVLRRLGPDDWARATGAGDWTVRDAAAHLLDGDVRRISAERDGHVAPPDHAIAGYDDLLLHLNEMNAQWTRAARRMSSRLLVDLLEYTGPVLATLMEGAPLESDATFPVAWAGQQRSPMWLDMGRELTERWHHQDQIREAVGAEPVAAPELLGAVIAVSLFALPAALDRVARPDGTRVAITARGPAGGTWHVERRAGVWRQVEADTAASPAARIMAADLDVARLLLHRLSAAQTAERIQLDGDLELAAALIEARAVMV